MRILILNTAFYFVYRQLKLCCFSPAVPSPSEWRGGIPRPLGQLTSWHPAKTTAKQLIQQKSAKITGQNLVALGHRVTRTGSEEVSSELLLAMANWRRLQLEQQYYYAATAADWYVRTANTFVWYMNTIKYQSHGIQPLLKLIAHKYTVHNHL